MLSKLVDKCKAIWHIELERQDNEETKCNLRFKCLTEQQSVTYENGEQ